MEKTSIISFLTPKSLCEHVESWMSLRQTIEKMEYHRYAVIPIIDKEGHYIRAISQGDILFFLKERNLRVTECSKINIEEVPSDRVYTPVKIDDDVKILRKLIIMQNFVPVIDDNGILIGIITRRALLTYLSKQ